MAGKLLSEQGPALKPFADAFSRATQSGGNDGVKFFENLGWSSTTERAVRPRKAKPKRRVAKKK